MGQVRIGQDRIGCRRLWPRMLALSIPSLCKTAIVPSPMPVHLGWRWAVAIAGNNLAGWLVAALLVCENAAAAAGGSTSFDPGGRLEWLLRWRSGRERARGVRGKHSSLQQSQQSPALQG